MAKQTTSATATGLRKELEALDEWLVARAPDLFDTLKRGATDKQLEKLSQRLFQGKKLPPLLNVWFRWHNGQSLDGGPILTDYKLRSFYLMSVADVIRSHRDTVAVHKCGELSGPWRSSWIPLLEGDFGDNLVFESTGPHKGVVRVLWHETSGREIVAKHLITLVGRIRKSLTRVRQDEVAQSSSDAQSINIPKRWAGSKAQKVTGAPPTAKALSTDSIGTAYVVGPFSINFYPFRAQYVAVKVADDTWISVEKQTLQEALDFIIDTVATVALPKWQHSHEKIALELSDHAECWGRQVRRRCITF